jgi:filamentous hemagglutinin family protein
MDSSPGSQMPSPQPRATTAQPRRHALPVATRLRLLAVAISAAPMVTFAQNPVLQPDGHGSDVRVSLDGNTTYIDQSSARAIVNWESFSVGAGHAAEFRVDGIGAADAAILNRVTGSLPSQIDGTLTAQGRVYLINPNGVIIGSTGIVNAHSFIASTLDIQDDDFLNATTNTFGGDSVAAISNLGTINASGGDVVLIARQIVNKGTITAADGGVLLGAGDEVEYLLASSANPRLLVRSTADVEETAGRIEHAGTLSGQHVELAAAVGNLYAQAIRVDGAVHATATAERDGRIYLTSDTGGIDLRSATLADDGAIHIQTKGDLTATAATVQAAEVVLTHSSIDLSDAAVAAGQLTLHDALGRTRVDNAGNAIDRLLIVREEESAGALSINGGSGDLLVDFSDLGGNGYSLDGDLTLRSEGDLTLSEAFAVRVFGTATLTAVDGIIDNQSTTATPFGSDVSAVRFYAARPGVTRLLRPDEEQWEVGHPDDPLSDVHTVFYYSERQSLPQPEPEPEPQPEPEPEPQPEPSPSPGPTPPDPQQTADTVDATQRATAVSAQQLQIPPPAFLPPTSNGSGAGPLPSGNRPGSMVIGTSGAPLMFPIYPQQALALTPESSYQSPISPEELSAFLQNASPAVISALLSNKEEIDRENTALQNSRKPIPEPGGTSPTETRERATADMLEQLLRSLSDDQKEVIAQLMQEIVDRQSKPAGTKPFNLDTPVSGLDPSAGVDPTRQQLINEKQQMAQQARAKEEAAAQQLKQKQNELITKLQQAQQDLKQQNEEAQRRATEAAQERFLADLSETERQAFQARVRGERQPVQQERSNAPDTIRPTDERHFPMPVQQAAQQAMLQQQQQRGEKQPADSHRATSNNLPNIQAILVPVNAGSKP